MSSSKKNLNKEIIALFSGQSSIITIPKLYIQLTGNHSLASVLNQSVFWSNKSICNNGYFYKTYKEWFEEINIPERTLRRYLNKLELIGWIKTKVKKVDGKNTKHVSPDMDRIIESISDMLTINCPIRPSCPNGLEDDQNHCSKVAPTGHYGRSEPANLSVSDGFISLYTEDNLQKKNISIVDFEKSTTNHSISPKQKLNAKDYEKDERFMRFYTAYPKHEQPRDAWKAFKSIVGNDDALLEHILNDLQVRKEKHTQWKDKQYIKLPAGYLRTGAFEGEIFNELEEQKQKQERDRIENERRLAEQAALSQKRADEIRQNDISKQSDAKTYRQVIKDAPKNPTERPVGLQNLIRSVGLNNNVNRK
jgi:hypothetical protein